MANIDNKLFTQDIITEEQKGNAESARSVFPTTPSPITLIEPNEENHTFWLNEEFLERILLDPKVADKKVFLFFNILVKIFNNTKQFIIDKTNFNSFRYKI